MRELKPCPFCGASSDRIILTEHEAHAHSPMLQAMVPGIPDHPGSWTIECGGCNVGMIDDTRAEVVAAWNRRAAPADVGEDGLPELPAPVRMSADQAYLGYTAEQVRQAQRDAIAAERDRNMARIQHLTHERDQARADCVRFEKAWHASFEQAMQNGQAFQELMAKNEDLRAQLAARGQGAGSIDGQLTGEGSPVKKDATPQSAALQEKP
jgi:hypothetical protein